MDAVVAAQTDGAVYLNYVGVSAAPAPQSAVSPSLPWYVHRYEQSYANLVLFAGCLLCCVGVHISFKVIEITSGT